MKIAILGYGLQGKSSYEYWREGNDITICDRNVSLEVPNDASTQLGEDYLANLDKFDLLVRSPNLHPRDIIKANSLAIEAKITSNTNEFMRVCPSKNIIGVTGTKGKGTTSTLITRMLEASGKKVHLGGNIGTPPLELLNPPAGGNIEPSDWVVLELANFQLIDLKYSPGLAVCLMVEPEHLDWHADMAEYIAAKSQLFRWQTTSDTAIYYAKNDISQQIASASAGQQVPFMKAPGAEVIDGKIVIASQIICDVSALMMLGKHNWQNACAATTAVWFSLSSVEGQITQNVEAIREVLTNFAGLPFRIELRAEKNNVRYYNDSFASGPGATLAAIDSIPGKKVMIMGGYDRGLDLTELAEKVKNASDEISKVLIIGASGQRLAENFDAASFDNYQMCNAKNMPEIVKAASTLAQPGDAVVLSPGFASFDMFKNFEDRGIKFNQAVDAL